MGNFMNSYTQFKWMKRCEVLPLYPVAHSDLMAYFSNHGKDQDSLRDLQLLKVPYYILASCEKGHIPTAEQLEEIIWDPCLQKGFFENYSLDEIDSIPKDISIHHLFDIHHLPGVTDNSARSLEDAFRLYDFNMTCFSGHLYILFTHGKVPCPIDESEVAQFISKIHNPLIEKASHYRGDDFNQSRRFIEIHPPVVNIAHDHDIKEISLDLSDDALMELSNKMCLALNLEEMKAIKSFYENPDLIKSRKDKGLFAYPTDVELEVLAQTWSEHCKHKIFASKINYTNLETGKVEEIDSLYKSYIKKSTKEIENSGVDWLVSVFSDNAGIVRFDSSIDLCIKVETHNSPSALDPYGGAITGILGVNRDILGCGLGAQPIANTNVFCLASKDLPNKIDPGLLPSGLMEPLELLKGVHKGVEDGGNKSGIPTVNGAMVFDSSYAGKPLVFCGTIGQLPAHLPDGREGSLKGAKAGDLIVVSGGGVGADGIHGATFSSMELGEDSPATAVQIGDPITQKRVMDFMLEARDKGLYTCVTDNGAGGISSSIGEMAELTGGAKIDLALHPLKYPGLSPWEIMISESQERMTFAIDPDKADEFLELSKKRGVTSTILGEFTSTGVLAVHYEDKLVAELDMEFLHEGVPQLELEATWSRDAYTYKNWFEEESLKTKVTSIAECTYQLLGQENIASKDYWVRQYDHEVKGATLIKPFSGAQGIGPDDSGIIDLEIHGGQKNSVVGVSCGLAPRFSLVDPNIMPKLAVDEAFRNLVSNGINPDKICLLDNFCWPDPVKSDRNLDGDFKLGQLVETCKGLYSISTLYKAPLVSGKDSMKNDFRGKSRSGKNMVISIKPTLLVTAMGHGNKAELVRAHASEGEIIYKIGPDFLTFKGSEYESLFQNISEDQTNFQDWDFSECLKIHKNIYQWIKEKWILSCHDISDGGLLCALSEMLFDQNIGLIDQSEREAFSPMELFGEGPGQYLVSIASEKSSEFEKILEESSLSFKKIGNTQQEPILAGSFLGNEKIDLKVAKSFWQNTWNGEVL